MVSSEGGISVDLQNEQTVLLSTASPEPDSISSDIAPDFLFRKKSGGWQFAVEARPLTD